MYRETEIAWYSFFLWFSTVVYEFQAKHTSFAILLNIGALVLNEEEHQHGV